jgi:tetratricopeptide (TPR) repeat protein
LAAQADKKSSFCEKCFATVPEGSPYCPECGASMDATQPAASDAEIYPALARANLLRMRGEYKQAEDVCLGILRRLPNNASAHTLLGDICAERGDLEEAVQWYDLALELMPDSQADREKLASVRRRIADREAAASAEKIGIPKARSTSVWVLGVALLLLAIIGIGAFILGRKSLPVQQRAQVDVGTKQPIEDVGTKEKTPPAQPHVDQESDDLQATLRQDPDLAKRVFEVVPSEMTVSIQGSDQEDLRSLILSVAGKVLEHAPNTQRVTVKCLSGVTVLRQATVERTVYEQAKAILKEGEKLSPDSVLSNEWPEPATSQAPSGTETSRDAGHEEPGR